MIELYLKEFEKLNSYQKEAVTSKERFLLLNAVVGSGKTTVLTHKVLHLHLIEKIPLEEMVVLTFTNKAANEIKERVGSFGEGLEDKMKYFGTFHSVARTILCESPILRNIGYREDFSIIDNEAAAAMMTEIIERENLKIKYKSKLMKRIDEFKNGKALYGVMKKDDDIEKLYNRYTEEKIWKNIMDFDDLIERCIEVLKEPLNPKWIIIDEMQDTDLRQLELVKRMVGVDTHVFAVGDPNQIIYSWRTGTGNIFNEFKNLFNPKEITLPVNYRSSRTILEAAKVFLMGGKIEGIKEQGNPIVIKRNYDAFNEALYLVRKIRAFHENGVPYKDIAVLYRRQAQGEVLSEVFEKEGIPYKVVFKSGLLNQNSDEDDQGDRVNLLTLHASKGLEFSHVFIIGVNMGNIPLTTKRGEEEEEARLFFVGMTRAKNHLEISYLTKPNIQGMTQYPSPYISMIPSNLVVREDEVSNTSLSDLMEMLREEREKKNKQEKAKKAVHPKYGEGIVKYEDEVIIRVEFEGYGEKEFSKMFCPLTIKE
jgi:superfamily I DNA/RNA helicase